MPKRTSSCAHSTSQQRSDANSATRKIERGPGQETREKLKAAELNLASSRRSVTSLELRPGKRPSEASERQEKMKTVYSGWEEPNLIHRTARRVNPDPQEEMSLTDYEELPPITQRERRSDQENPVTRVRTRPEPPLSPPRENETFKRNRPSRNSMETPCIHIDPSRTTRPRPDFRYASEAPSRVPARDSYRNEDLPRYPSTQEQDTYTETSSMSSARRRPRSPQYESPRREEMERRLGPVRETSRTSGTEESIANNLEALIGVLQAPKVDLPTFKGDPMQYHIFMRAFDDNVERVMSDPSSKLARLMQLCAGEAARVIQGCTLMRPERGYVRARQLLKDRYGDEFLIAEL